MKGKTWAWITFALGCTYFFVPLIATIEFSMRMKRGEYSFEAYRVVFGDERFHAAVAADHYAKSLRDAVDVCLRTVRITQPIGSAEIAA